MTWDLGTWLIIIDSFFWAVVVYCFIRMALIK